MQVEILTLCEDIGQRPDGAYILINPFDTFRSFTVPYLHSKCFIFGKIRFNKPGSYYVRAKLVDRHNNLVTQLFEGPIEVDDSPEQSGSASFPFQLDNLKFDTHGRYSIVLSVDKERLFTLPCFVIPPSARMPPPN